MECCVGCKNYSIQLCDIFIDAVFFMMM